MTFQVSFAKPARSEFVEAAAWYEAKHTDLGVEFMAEIERCIALAADNPGQYPVVYKGLRRVTTKRFPYGIYFQASRQPLTVVAVFHSRRDPAQWQERV